MEVLHAFLRREQRTGDSLTLNGGGGVLELTRAAAGLYVRITLQGDNRYLLQVVQNGGERPKQAWYDGKSVNWADVSRGEVRERCEKLLRT